MIMKPNNLVNRQYGGGDGSGAQRLLPQKKLVKPQQITSETESYPIQKSNPFCVKDKRKEKA